MQTGLGQREQPRSQGEMAATFSIQTPGLASNEASSSGSADRSGFGCAHHRPQWRSSSLGRDVEQLPAPLRRLQSGCVSGQVGAEVGGCE